MGRPIALEKIAPGAYGARGFVSCWTYLSYEKNIDFCPTLSKALKTHASGVLNF